MATVTKKFKTPIKVGTQDFHKDRLEIYNYLLEHDPVSQMKVSVLKMWGVARYDDCMTVLKSPHMFRDRSRATGKGGTFPFPLPKHVQRVAISMITTDDPEHRRLRNLVHKAFTPRSLQKIAERVEEITHELLDNASGTVDLMQVYSLPIPVTVIREMLGIEQEDMDDLRNAINYLTNGMSGLSVIRTLLFDMPKASKFIERIIAKKRDNPADDILTGLIHAEEEGETLSDDELVAMVFLLIIAGYETTVHLINNAVITLIEHPDQLDRLRAEPELMESAIEEILRFAGPIEGTKMFYPNRDIRLSGVTIPKGATVMPLLGAANRDPRQFENPHVFDIARTPNRHLGFSHGIHYCLGAPLARLETQTALRTLFDRYPNIRLAVDSSDLEVMNVPLWIRHKAVPVILE